MIRGDSSRVEIFSLSVVGQVRSENQDSYAEFERPDGARLMIVADGMGGHQGGATASKVATRTMGEVFASSPDEGPDSAPLDSEELLHEAITAANLRVHTMSQKNRHLRGMGTTIVALLIDREGLAWVAHVGDSRVYRIRDRAIEQITDDHSVVGEMVRRGVLTDEEAQVHPHRNRILRSVGIDTEVNIDTSQVTVAPGDCFLLCSDGLTDMVLDSEIASVINLEPRAQAVQSLIDLANNRGGIDNITAQVVSIPTQLPVLEAPGETESHKGGTNGSSSSQRQSQPKPEATANGWLQAGFAAVLFTCLAIYFALGDGY